MLPKSKTKPKATLNDLTALVYGPSKIGKSTWCSHAENALFLATEPGLNALEVFEAPITCWDDLLQACAEIAEGKHDFKTIVIDTVDNAYRMCADYVCKKFKIEHESDLGYGKGYALINNEFQRVLNKLAFLPYGLILISHSHERDIETRTGKHTRIVPTLPDKARKLVTGLVDLILFCDLDMKTGDDGKPMLKWALKILGPTHKGRLLWRNNVIASKDNVKWLKQDLYTCGLQMDKLSDLPGKLETLLDVGLEVTKRTKNEFENIYFNRRIVLSDEDAAAPSAGHDVDDMIPF